MIPVSVGLFSRFYSPWQHQSGWHGPTPGHGPLGESPGTGTVGLRARARGSQRPGLSGPLALAAAALCPRGQPLARRRAGPWPDSDEHDDTIQ